MDKSEYRGDLDFLKRFTSINRRYNAPGSYEPNTFQHLFIGVVHSVLLGGGLYTSVRFGQIAWLAPFALDVTLRTVNIVDRLNESNKGETWLPHFSHQRRK